MSDFLHSGGFPSIWIDSCEPLPNTCITCGMFTDHFVKSKFVHKYQKEVAAGESGPVVALGCLAHLLGPMGMVLAAALNGGNKEGQTKEKTMTQKSSIKVPCCKLCAGQKIPEAIEASPGNGRKKGRFLFEVHPRFAERLTLQRQQTEAEEQS